MDLRRQGNRILIYFQKWWSCPDMLAAVSPQGFMNWMVFEDNCDSKKFIEFLGRLRRQVKQKVFLIVDNHRVHHSKKVRAYVEKFKDDIELFFCRHIALN